MFKKSRFYVAISLVVQAITMFFLFLILWGKKKSISGAFLAVAAMEGTAGAYLLYQLKQEWDAEMCFDAFLDGDESVLDDALLDCDLRHGKDDDEMYEEISFEIPREDAVSEEEFKDR